MGKPVRLFSCAWWVFLLPHRAIFNLSHALRLRLRMLLSPMWHGVKCAINPQGVYGLFRQSKTELNCGLAGELILAGGGEDGTDAAVVYLGSTFPGLRGLGKGDGSNPSSGLLTTKKGGEDCGQADGKAKTFLR